MSKGWECSLEFPYLHPHYHRHISGPLTLTCMRLKKKKSKVSEK